MAFKPLLAFAVTGIAAAASHTGFPVEIGIPLPLPKDERRLRGPPPLGLDMSFGPVAFGAIPLGAIPLDLPLMEGMQGPPVVMDGPLRDLLDFGSAFGAAVLTPKDLLLSPLPSHRSFAGGDFGAPLELPMDALHVKMQQQTPAPLDIDDSHGKVRIYGVLPKNLTPKTLKVSLSGRGGRDLMVQYFLGQGAEASNVVGIDERFALDFEPTDAPKVSYKAATGAFELVLSRPAGKPQEEDVAINFDATPAKPAKATPEVAPAHAEVVLKRHHSVRRTAAKEASVKEFVHDSKLTRRPVSQVTDLHKVTKELHEVANKPVLSKAQKDRAERVKVVADKAKQFVADAHLGEAHQDMVNAFAPLDLGLVMLELNHHARAH